MAFLDTKILPRQGAALAQGHRARNRNLVLVYCGVIAALSLGSNGLNLVLNDQISTTGGLDGLGLRSVLQTVQQVLSYINIFFTPFWSAGFLFAMVNMVRGESPRCTDLLEGFRRFGRVLLATLYEAALTLSLALSTFLLAMLIFSFTPMAEKFLEIMLPITADPNIYLPDGSINMELIPAEAITMGSIPMIVIWMVLLLAACMYLSYCFRMGPYLMMERKIGGVAALFESRRLMRGHKWQMLKLDLRFWWYHGLGVLVSAVCYLDVILALLGVPVPFGEMTMYFLTLGAYCVLLTALYLWKKCDVDAAYVLAYEAIAHPIEDAVAEVE